MCNYCTLKRIKEQARGKARVHQVPRNGGLDIYVVPKGEKLDTSIDKVGNPGPHWKDW